MFQWSVPSSTEAEEQEVKLSVYFTDSAAGVSNQDRLSSSTRSSSVESIPAASQLLGSAILTFTDALTSPSQVVGAVLMLAGSRARTAALAVTNAAKCHSNSIPPPAPIPSD